jgi:AcrR family transcriptional regulator
MTATRQPRADAQRNRDKLLAAARATFTEDGLDAPLDDIAKRAGVGNATLYRHFPTRDDLITAVFIERAAENIARAERALQHDDPWAGFAEYVLDTCREQAADADIVAAQHPSRELKRLRTRAYNAVNELIERAKTNGTLRADFTPEDVVLLLLATAGILRRTGTTAPEMTDRFLALALDGLRAEGATPAPPPITVRQIKSTLG